MRQIFRMVALVLAIGFLATASSAQQSRQKSVRGSSNNSDVDTYVAKMMAFDKNKDEKLTKEEITDERLLRVFTRADANKDGIVTKDELTVLAKQETVQTEGSGPNFGEGKKGGFGGFGKGKEGGGKGGFGRGKEGFPKEGPQGGGFGGGPIGFGPSQPGQIMPPFIQDMLKLTEDQKKQLTALQKEVDTNLEKLLTEEQKKQLKEFRENGPRGFGGGGFGGGGFGGRGGFGGGGFPPKKDNPKEDRPKKD